MFAEPDSFNNLALYWPMAGETVSDISGNGNDGSIVGSEPVVVASRLWKGGPSVIDPAASAGVGLEDINYIVGDGDDVTVVPIPGEFGLTTADLPIGIFTRWAQEWYVTSEQAVASRQPDGLRTIIITFDISEAGGAGDFDANQIYELIVAPDNGTFTSIPVLNRTIAGDQVSFELDATLLGPNTQRMTLGFTQRIYLPMIPSP